ncbi:TetR/AcrR family transcriptional regulator [Nocardiopsis exhalans]|uniref:TetR/AcrR family transcriptional regulator n=1 Tax=Nocardiopsis exhalans TaxID=163604 RepID=A0ABY5D384_9ACTN|nr:TetR/AcrR family transcriptional regulator [Nocardiopsis exhalans]USY18779.1 TetR/AcrR family transcriptional regulator [Nocardiopsis exhalans]
MTTDNGRQPRADAVRNAERILRTARTVFADLGPDAPLEEVARRADVRIRTLFNHFPSKGELVRAALEQSAAEELTPAIERALADEDPMRGLVSLIEAAMGLASRELNTLAAAHNTGVLAAEANLLFENSLAALARRAQDAGLLRPDLVPEDLPRIMAMLVSTLWTMDPDTDGWRRYLALMLEGLAPSAASPLPPPVTLLTQTRAGVR